MTADTARATLDRIVDGTHAVLLLGDETGAVVDEHVVDAEDLPPEGRREGAVLDVTVVDGAIETVTYRPSETESRRAAAQERLDRLSTPLSDVEAAEERVDTDETGTSQEDSSCHEE